MTYDAQSLATDPEAQRLAGEILVLDQKGKGRSAAEEARFAVLLQSFGDHEGAAISMVRLFGKL